MAALPGGQRDQVSTPEDIVQGIDHLIVTVPDLDRAERLWQRLGFATTARGFHLTGGTANHLIMLDQTYIELLGQADRSTTSAYQDMIEHPGLWGVALRASAQETYRLWSDAGLPVTPPADLERGVEIGGHSELARFRLTMLERSAELPFLTFCCEHLTPQFVWHAQLAPHPNGARVLRELVVLVEDDTTRRHVARLAGRPIPEGASIEGTFVLGDARITLLSEASFERRFGVPGRRSGRRLPMLAAFVLASVDLKRAREFAERSGYHVQGTASGGFAAHLPDEGVVIEWSTTA